MVCALIWDALYVISGYFRVVKNEAGFISFFQPFVLV